MYAFIVIMWYVPCDEHLEYLLLFYSHHALVSFEATAEVYNEVYGDACDSDSKL